MNPIETIRNALLRRTETETRTRTETRTWDEEHTIAEAFVRFPHPKKESHYVEATEIDRYEHSIVVHDIREANRSFEIRDGDLVETGDKLERMFSLHNVQDFDIDDIEHVVKVVEAPVEVTEERQGDEWVEVDATIVDQDEVSVEWVDADEYDNSDDE